LARRDLRVGEREVRHEHIVAQRNLGVNRLNDKPVSFLQCFSTILDRFTPITGWKCRNVIDSQGFPDRRGYMAKCE
jgi:hypothetical protein